MDKSCTVKHSKIIIKTTAQWTGNSVTKTWQQYGHTEKQGLGSKLRFFKVHGENRAITDLEKLQILNLMYKLFNIYIIPVWLTYMKLLRASELNCGFDSCSAQEETLGLFC